MSQEYRTQVRQSEMSMARDLGQESRKSEYKALPVSISHVVCPLAPSELFVESRAALKSRCVQRVICSITEDLFYLSLGLAQDSQILVQTGNGDLAASEYFSQYRLHIIFK